MDRPLLVCLDLQRIFIEDGPLRAPAGADALLECARLLSHARRERWTIVHCFLRRAGGSMPVGAGQSLPIPGFEPQFSEVVIERRTLSAYGHTAFGCLLDEASKRSALVAGLSASITFMATAFDAFERGHRFVVAADALASHAGFEASAAEHSAVARDVAAQLGFPAAVTRQHPESLARGVAALLTARRN